MRIGMICPYSFDIPGGVQAHILEIAEDMRALGHHVEVLGPGIKRDQVPDHVILTGGAIPVPFNGSVARIALGPRHYRQLKTFIEQGNFDVLHLHEPASPSLTLMATYVARGPLVGTFHASGRPSLSVKLFRPFLSRRLERLTGRIAVSNMARRWQMDGIGGDAALIPNGVRVEKYRRVPPLAGYEERQHPVVLFLGRYDEERKGMRTLKEALPRLHQEFPDLELLVVGDGNAERLRRDIGQDVETLTLLGHVDEETKARVFRSADVYVAPNTGGESFGIVLTEAMSAGIPVVASDLPAFRAVLDQGRAGWLTQVGNSQELADTIIEVITNPSARTHKVVHATQTVAQYDWSVVTQQVLQVYNTVTAPSQKVTLA